MSNNAHCKVAGTKKFRIKMFNVMVRILDEVRHILDLKRNLISFNILDSKGHKYMGEDGILKVSKDVRVALQG